MYSTKTIEKILISSLQENRVNKKPVLADTLSENTRSQYQYIEDIDTIKEVLARPEFSQAVEAYKNGQRIYRGQRRQEKHLAAIVIPGTRRSKDSSNLYTRLLSDIFPSWSEYPKRNKSAICTNNSVIAEDFSNRFVFVIFPQNNTKIGECPKGDIWDSFSLIKEQLKCNLDYFTTTVTIFISHTLNQTYYDINEIFLSGTKQDILRLFNLVENKCQTELNESEYRQILEKNDIKFSERHSVLFNTAKKGKLLNYIEYLLNPKANNFRLITVNKVPKDNEHELWFEGQHLMIREDVVNEIFEN